MIALSCVATCLAAISGDVAGLDRLSFDPSTVEVVHKRRELTIRVKLLDDRAINQPPLFDPDSGAIDQALVLDEVVEVRDRYPVVEHATPVVTLRTFVKSIGGMSFGDRELCASAGKFLEGHTVRFDSGASDTPSRISVEGLDASPEQLRFLSPDMDAWRVLPKLDETSRWSRSGVALLSLLVPGGSTCAAGAAGPCVEALTTAADVATFLATLSTDDVLQCTCGESRSVRGARFDDIELAVDHEWKTTSSSLAGLVWNEHWKRDSPRRKLSRVDKADFVVRVRGKGFVLWNTRAKRQDSSAVTADLEVGWDLMIRDEDKETWNLAGKAHCHVESRTSVIDDVEDR